MSNISQNTHVETKSSSGSSFYGDAMLPTKLFNYGTDKLFGFLGILFKGILEVTKKYYEVAEKYFSGFWPALSGSLLHPNGSAPKAKSAPPAGGGGGHGPHH